MIRKFRSLCARILSGIVPVTEMPEKGFGDKPPVHRRVEITVERESVSVDVTGQPGDRPEGKGCGKGMPEAPSSQLQLAPSTVSHAVQPESERPARTLDQKSREE